MACGGTRRSGKLGDVSNKLKPALQQCRFGWCSMKLPRRRCGATSLLRHIYGWMQVGNDAAVTYGRISGTDESRSTVGSPEGDAHSPRAPDEGLRDRRS